MGSRITVTLSNDDIVQFDEGTNVDVKDGALWIMETLQKEQTEHESFLWGLWEWTRPMTTSKSTVFAIFARGEWTAVWVDEYRVLPKADEKVEDEK